MMKYEFFLQNDKIRKYRMVSWLVILLNLVAIAYMAINAEYSTRILSISLLIIIPALLAWWYYSKRTPQEFDILFNYIFGAFFFNWLITSQFWLTGLMLVLCFLQGLALKKNRVQVAAEKITYPSFPVKDVQWNELNNIMIKDGLLTIDFKNDKLIQQLIDGHLSSVNEREFNEFCSQQLRK